MFLFLCLALIVPALCDDCDQYGTLLYEDLGCTPEFVKGKKCPLKYNCTEWNSTNENCQFKGRIYQVGEQLEDSLLRPSCEGGCSCGINGKSSGFTCAVSDCPEWLGHPLTPGCYRKYSLDRCCSVGEICPPFDKIEKCIVGGTEYLEGERFDPEDSCLECVCEKGFQGKLEKPFCRRKSCGQNQLRNFKSIQKSCAPLYSKQVNQKVLCCPSSWICPDGTESAIHGEAESDEKCKYGDKSLNVGQYFEKSNLTDYLGRNYGIRCECVIPPFVNCHHV